MRRCAHGRGAERVDGKRCAARRARVGSHGRARHLRCQDAGGSRRGRGASGAAGWRSPAPARPVLPRRVVVARLLCLEPALRLGGRAHAPRRKHIGAAVRGSGRRAGVRRAVRGAGAGHPSPPPAPRRRGRLLLRRERPVEAFSGAGSRRWRAGRRGRHHGRCGNAAPQDVRRAQLRALGRVRRHRRAGRLAPRPRGRRRPAGGRVRPRVHRLLLGACVHVLLVPRAHGERRRAGVAAARQPALEQRLLRDAGQGRRHHGHAHAEHRQTVGVADRAGSARRPAGSGLSRARQAQGAHPTLDGGAAGLGGHAGSASPFL